MGVPRKYMAGWVPRYLRQSKLGYLPIDNVICTQNVRDANGVNHYTDLVMLPVREFQRMRSYVGLQHAASLNLGMASYDPVFVVRETKEVTVPDNVADPFGFARVYFLKAYGVIKQKELGVEDEP